MIKKRPIFIWDSKIIMLSLCYNHSETLKDKKMDFNKGKTEGLKLASQMDNQKRNKLLNEFVFNETALEDLAKEAFKKDHTLRKPDVEAFNRGFVDGFMEAAY